VGQPPLALVTGAPERGSAASRWCSGERFLGVPVVGAPRPTWVDRALVARLAACSVAQPRQHQVGVAELGHGSVRGDGPDTPTPVAPRIAEHGLRDREALLSATGGAISSCECARLCLPCPVTQVRQPELPTGQRRRRERRTLAAWTLAPPPAPSAGAGPESAGPVRDARRQLPDQPVRQRRQRVLGVAVSVG